MRKLAILESTIAWEAANCIATAAAKHASEMGLKVCAAVVDRHGALLSMLRITGAPFHSTDIAADKAYTAASFRLSTDELAKMFNGHSEAVQQGMPLRPRVVLFGGGIPLFYKKECIGAVGVSGGSESQDIECAMSGVEAMAGFSE